MGLKTTERPPTPGFLDCSPKTLAEGSGAGGVTGAWSVSPAVPDTRSRETDNAGNTCGGRSPWDGLARGTTGASRTSPRLASPTAERHLASLLQQLRRER
ncbi:hypothetical protein MRX96_037796 [Rhipicephalus microplus]